MELPQGARTPIGDPEGSRLAIRLGITRTLDGKGFRWVYWKPDEGDPHCLVVGRTGTGKSVTIRAMLAQVLESFWQVIIGDPKGADYKWVRGLPDVQRFGVDVSHRAIDAAHAEMKKRQLWLESHDDRAAKLSEVKGGHPFRPCLVILDETTIMLNEVGDAEDPKAEKARKAESFKKLGDLLRLARFSEIFVCIGMQRPDAAILGGESRFNLGTRILMGEGDATSKGMAFGDIFPDGPIEVDPTSGEPPVGRGRVQTKGGIPVETQFPWISVDDILEVRLPSGTGDDPEPGPSLHGDAHDGLSGAGGGEGQAAVPLPPMSDEQIRADLDRELQQILGGATPSEGAQAVPPPPGATPSPSPPPSPPVSRPNSDTSVFQVPPPPPDAV